MLEFAFSHLLIKLILSSVYEFSMDVSLDCTFCPFPFLSAYCASLSAVHIPSRLATAFLFWKEIAFLFYVGMSSASLHCKTFSPSRRLSQSYVSSTTEGGFLLKREVILYFQTLRLGKSGLQAMHRL